MTEFLIANMAPIMFASLIVFLMFGYAVTFSLAACGLFFGFVGVELGVIQATFLQSLPLRMFGIMQNDTLLAIPFFTFMGIILERSGMAEDLLETVGQVFGPVRGGVAIAVILVGALIVASIETVWGGPVSPYRSRQDDNWNLTFERGAEIGRFSLGSTVIVATEPGRLALSPDLVEGRTVRMGTAIGAITG